MSIPTAVFLDTSILAGQQYNFQSTALSTFGPACAARWAGRSSPTRASDAPGETPLAQQVRTAVHGEVETYQRWAVIVARFSFETYHLQLGA